MTLYRATYQRPIRAGSGIRGLTFAATDPQQAQRVAESWALRDRLLTLNALRGMQRTLTLTGDSNASR